MSRLPDEDDPGRRRWRRRTMVAIGVVIVVATGATVRLASRSGSHDAVRPAALTTATVQRTDLAETTPVDGVVGFGGPGGGGPMSIVQPGGTAASALDKERQAAASAQQALAADGQAAADAGAADDQSIDQAQRSLSAADAALGLDSATEQEAQATLAVDERRLSDCRGAGPSESGSSDPCADDEARVAADRTAVTAARKEVASDEAAVAAAHGQLASTQLKAAQDANQGRAKVAADELALTTARSAVTDSQAAQTSYEATSRYTSLPAIGQIVQPGQALWSVDGRQVALLPGTLIPWRAFFGGMSAGPDIAALDQALIDLGHGKGLSVSNEFTSATGAAIRRLQAVLGEPRTGTLPLGSVVFAPTSVRVAAVHPQLGAPVAAGAPVLDVSSTTPIVEVALPVGQSHLVRTGDHVSVTLPDRTTSEGTISAVGTVATTTNATGTDGASSTGSSSAAPSATISVTVTLANTDGTAGLDQAPVTVNITNDTVKDVLAVPTTALVALAGGGYAVEVVDPNRRHRLLPVKTGIFDDQAGLVQVTGAGLAEGQKVVAPA